MRRFRAKNKENFRQVGKVYLDGQEVTKTCIAFYGSSHPEATAPGTVLIGFRLPFSSKTEQGWFGTYFKRGLVRWAPRDPLHS